jgi:hypothetical protein
MVTPKTQALAKPREGGALERYVAADEIVLLAESHGSHVHRRSSSLRSSFRMQTGRWQARRSSNRCVLRAQPCFRYQSRLFRQRGLPPLPLFQAVSAPQLGDTDL